MLSNPVESAFFRHCASEQRRIATTYRRQNLQSVSHTFRRVWRKTRIQSRRDSVIGCWNHFDCRYAMASGIPRRGNFPRQNSSWSVRWFRPLFVFPGAAQWLGGCTYYSIATRANSSIFPGGYPPAKDTREHSYRWINASSGSPVRTRIFNFC